MLSRDSDNIKEIAEEKNNNPAYFDWLPTEIMVYIIKEFLTPDAQLFLSQTEKDHANIGLSGIG